MTTRGFKVEVKGKILTIIEGDKEIMIGYNGDRMEELKKGIKEVE